MSFKLNFFCIKYHFDDYQIMQTFLEETRCTVETHAMSVGIFFIDIMELLID